MKLGLEVHLGPGHIVLDRYSQLSSPKRAQPTNFANVCCGQTAGWIKMSLGTEVGLDPYHIARWGTSPPPKRGGGKL